MEEKTAENHKPPIDIPTFSKEQFLDGTVVEWLEAISNKYTKTLAEGKLRDRAKELKVSGAFSKLLKAYQVEHRSSGTRSPADRLYFFDGLLNSDDQTMALDLASWNISEDTGEIWRLDQRGNQLIACSHPILPVKIMRAVDTGTVSVRLAFLNHYQGRKMWQYITLPKSKISSARDIVNSLADQGVSVISGLRAQALVEFLCDMIDYNSERIPEVKSISRLGWNEDGFSPYVGGVEFDSADTFKPIFRAITRRGSFDEWLKEAKDIRSYSAAARIVLAASFASVLVEPLGCLPFFVHLWSMESGTGKTVAQMLGASVWGDPSVGGAFFQSFLSTTTGVELIAGFLHSIPLFLDELQLAKDAHGRSQFDVYKLAEGSGKLRSNRNLGLNYTPKWANCFITSGETPMINENDGAGAVNRVIEINCIPGAAVIRDGHRTANLLKANFGFAGKKFVGKLAESDNLDRAKALFEQFNTACLRNDTTGKQAMAAAVILTADALATEWIFQDGRTLTVDEISAFLKERSQVSAGERGYETMCGWVGANASRFQNEPPANGEHYGVLMEKNGIQYAVINRQIWDRECANHGVAPKALLEQLRAMGLLRVRKKGFTRTCRIGSLTVDCVWMKLPIDHDDEDLDNSDDFDQDLPL